MAGLNRNMYRYVYVALLSKYTVFHKKHFFISFITQSNGDQFT